MTITYEYGSARGQIKFQRMLLSLRIFTKSNDMGSPEMINYSGIIFSCYADNNTSCVHAIKDHSLIYTYAGKLLVEDRGKELTILPGECVFIRRNHRVRLTKLYADKQPYKGITFLFRRNFLREFYNNMGKKEKSNDIKAPEENVFRIPLRPDMSSLFHSLLPYFDSSVQPTNDIIKLKEQEAVYSLLNTDNQFSPVLFDFTEPWKIDIIDFLNENYMYDLTLEEIASYTGRSLATFKRDFAKVSELPPRKWLIKKRLEVAYDKIMNQDMKVRDVYAEVGFKNLSHFYKAFKKQYGFSPKNKHNTTPLRR